jgi:hypothetical protein
MLEIVVVALQQVVQVAEAERRFVLRSYNCCVDSPARTTERCWEIWVRPIAPAELRARGSKRDST